jgi:hypothetical protein
MPLRPFEPSFLIPLLAVAAVTPPASAVGRVDFNRDIRPILSGTCFKCHGIDDGARKGKLRLDVREGALKGGKSGHAAVVPNKPDESELVRRVFTSDEDDVMPPPGTKVPLTPEQKDVLRRWIAEGAEYKTHWAWVAPIEAPLPEVKHADWPQNAIDRFVLAKLEAEKLRPSPEADKYTLIRRLSFDLTGLPPTPDEADAFVNDPSADAYEMLVDRLLASPHYGERWARRWLDLARYADTNGFEKDRPRQIWPYRDWVIDAINADMPFDQFTVKQIAGDLLPGATVADRIATGFHRNTMRNEEGGIDPLEYRFYSVVDRVGTTSTAWLGLTVACAQCHTHKYDPIKHTDYYSLMAFLDNCDEPEMPLPLSAEQAAKKAEVEGKVAALTASLADKWTVDAPARWETPAAVVSSASGETPVSAGDGSWRFTGPSPTTDTYTFVVESSLPSVDRIKVEALADGDRGPGRTPHGNFVLSQIDATVAPTDPAGGKATPVKITRAEADFSQENFRVGDALDAKPRTGWGVSPATGKDHAATFHLERPVSSGQGSRWTIRLRQMYGSQHTMGRVRVSLGTSAPAKDANGSSVTLASTRKAALEAAFAEWEATAASRAVQWTTLRPAELKSNSPTLTLLDDDSVLASGDITKSDTFDLAFRTDLSGVTAVRIEALPHDSLPRHGPGMVDYEGPFGDFSLSEVFLTADGTKGKFTRAVHSFAAPNMPASNAIDGNQQTGWMINGGQGKAHYAVFCLESPTGSARDLRVGLLFEKYYAAALGHFRVAVTTDPRAGEAEALPPDVEAALLVPAAERTPAQRDVLMRHFLSIAPQLATARKQIEDLRKTIPSPQTTLVMAERPADHARKTRLHHRGEFLQPKDEVQPAIPSFLPPLPAGAKADRLSFARWLVARENPLTARVQVNRRWAAMFGRGIVRTTEDFGFQGELPSDQDLLDWLAVEFMKRGWSGKRLDRLIVTSATYRQSSAVTPELLARDPQNVLLARGPRFRVEAEMVRDAALKESGLLSVAIGGPSVFPPQPASVTTEGTYGPLAWNTSTGEARFRRSLYTFAKRTAPFAMYNTFDAPTGEACVARRDTSNTPLQALTILNDTVFLEAAQALGRVGTSLKGSDEAVATALYRRCLTRPPEKDELGMLVEYARRQRARFKSGELDPAKVAGEGDGDAVERATWTVVARAILNVDEAITKN